MDYKIIPGIPRWKIYPDGKIESVKTGKIVKHSLNAAGYPVVSNYLVHRLVARAFIPNPNNFPLVCHKDDNRANPNVDNLFWGTHAMNSMDSVLKGRHGAKPKPVVDLETGVIYPTTGCAIRDTGVYNISKSDRFEPIDISDCIHLFIPSNKI